MSCSKPDDFSPKSPAETVTVAFEFKRLTASPSSPVVTATRYSGAEDPSPQSILLGPPQIAGTQVLQLVTAGVDGCTYWLECGVDAPGSNHFVLPGLLPVCSGK